MKRYSDKRQKQEIKLARLRDEMRADNPRCFFYPGIPGTEIHHLIPRSTNTSLIAERDNLIPLSVRAHTIIHTGTTADLRELPAANFREYLELMKKLDPIYHSRFMVRFM